MNAAAVPQLGLFGKLPAEGDFVSRRLPWDFMSAWDGWLQAGLAASRQALGARWLDAYLTAPVWRFQLRPGVAGAQGWLGLCFPSVDRVGRYFPFTVAAALPPQAAQVLLPVQADAALTALEALALQALDPNTPLAALDARLAGADLGFTAQPWAQGSTPATGRRRFGPEASASDVRAACAGLAPAPATFFTWGSDALPATLLGLDGLPTPQAFAALLADDVGAVPADPIEKE